MKEATSFRDWPEIEAWAERIGCELDQVAVASAARA
jgi:hypothetical protein